MGAKLITRSTKEYDQIVMGEVLIPNTPNSWGDIYTVDAIRDFAHAFMVSGLNGNVGNDIEHDNVDMTGSVYVVESFIVRAGDPDFIEGAWVIAMQINDDDIWQQVLDGDINGFSYEALCGMTPITFDNLRSRTIAGITAPDLIDGHTHTYVVTVDARNRPISGATGETDGHTHAITTHTVTGSTNGHKHRFNVLDIQGEKND